MKFKYLLLLSAALLAFAGCETLSTSSKPTRVVITGGGSSHDFDKWFNKADVATLSASGRFAPVYTEQLGTLPEALGAADVLCLTHNKAFPDAASKEAVARFAATKSRGIVIVHAGGWYNWKDWPEFNRDIVTGGSRGHDRLGEFEVKNIRPDHPVMKGVPASFKITDELYNFQPDEAGPGREVLATATSPVTGKTFPIVWIVKSKGARIVCITLGHDGRAHDLPAYKALLQNSIAWSARR